MNSLLAAGCRYNTSSNEGQHKVTWKTTDISFKIYLTFRIVREVACSYSASIRRPKITSIKGLQFAGSRETDHFTNTFQINRRRIDGQSSSRPQRWGKPSDHKGHPCYWLQPVFKFAYLMLATQALSGDTSSLWRHKLSMTTHAVSAYTGSPATQVFI